MRRRTIATSARRRSDGTQQRGKHTQTHTHPPPPLGLGAACGPRGSVRLFLWRCAQGAGNGVTPAAPPCFMCCSLKSVVKVACVGVVPSPRGKMRKPRTQQHNSIATQQRNNTTAQQHNSAATQQHSSTTAQQHNSTATRQHEHEHGAALLDTPSGGASVGPARPRGRRPLWRPRERLKAASARRRFLSRLANSARAFGLCSAAHAMLLLGLHSARSSLHAGFLGAPTRRRSTAAGRSPRHTHEPTPHARAHATRRPCHTQEPTPHARAQTDRSPSHAPTTTQTDRDRQASMVTAVE